MAEGGRPGSFEWRPTQPLRGGSWYLRATYRTDRTGTPHVGIDRGAGYRRRDDRLLAPRPRGGTSLLPLAAYSLGAQTVTRIRLAVPPGHRACFTRFVVGSYAPRAS